MAEEMPEKVKKLFAAFKTAVDSERKAQSMYKDMIAICEDEEIRKVLVGFYEDEVRHEQELIRRYNMLREKQ